MLAVLGVVTLLFTAFGSSGSSGPAPIAIETVSLADATAVRPRPQVLASIGNLRIQLPVAAGALTAMTEPFTGA